MTVFRIFWALVCLWFVYEGIKSVFSARIELEVRWFFAPKNYTLTGIGARLYGVFLAALGSAGLYHNYLAATQHLP